MADTHEDPGVTLPRDSEPDPGRVEGYLWKRGGRWKTWKRRWFVLQQATLIYYYEQGDKIPINFIQIQGCEVKSSEAKTKSDRYCFLLITRSHNNKRPVYLLGATDSDERDRWIQCLSYASIQQPLQPPARCLKTAKRQWKTKDDSDIPEDKNGPKLSPRAVLRTATGTGLTRFDERRMNDYLQTIPNNDMY
eukprot:TRINITY_DN15088_c0_g1::TRINITY_DN15088_c0_g1_i1::g.24920::m.24920 TRINITY_DN15088_c0_g1::TRINITY_DN15088_c0_g1_i1::g.24920  ORF type:complete len:204 (-),score=15.74,sp/Q8N4B1/SESQ1_HUMAN/32.99/8e-13,PH/PF00169.24/3.7e-19,PH_11/PF15413.1/2e-06,PH_8/PF15409.1/0.012 TRINITY_DN15088_c0_g1_i1:960-1535(-)